MDESISFLLVAKKSSGWYFESVIFLELYDQDYSRSWVRVCF